MARRTQWAVLAPLSVAQLRSLGAKNLSVDRASKGAINALTRMSSNLFAPRKIRVNAVKSTVVETERLGASHFLDKPDVDMLRGQTLLRRFGKPDDIAPAVVFLASTKSAWDDRRVHCRFWRSELTAVAPQTWQIGA